MTAAYQTPPFDANRSAALAGELAALAKVGLGIPDMPFSVLSALKPLAPLPIAQLCVCDERGAVLLTRREDRHWWGWHFPGGFMAPCERVARLALVEAKTCAPTQLGVAVPAEHEQQRPFDPADVPQRHR